MVSALLLPTAALATTVLDPREAPPLVTSGSVIGGASFGDFSNSPANVSVGAGWALRGELVLLRYFGIEASYQGMINTVNPINNGTVFAPPGTNLLLSELAGDFVPGFPIMIGDHELRPYGLVGVGYGHVGTNNATFGLLAANGINAVAVPVGAGVSYQVAKGVVVDTRFTYNFLVDSLGYNWNLGFNLGAAFGP
jgi:opacity protein-like surface antigen